MKNDIKNRKDIELLINSFYSKVKVDPVIGYFFTEVQNVNWEIHLPKMYDFWENIIFNTGNYEGNPMAQHQDLHKKSALSKAHFDHWIALFTNTVDQLFAGEKAELTKQRATSISTVMQIKIVYN
jgi:hemoglobin